MSETPKFWYDLPFTHDHSGSTCPRCAADAKSASRRSPLPSGPVEEFTQTPGEHQVVEAESMGDWARRYDADRSAEAEAEVSRGPQFDPRKFMDALNTVLNVESGEGLRRLVSDPESENIKGPTPYSDKSPISFYFHNQAEIDRLRSKLVRYQSRIERIRDLVKDLLVIIEVDQ